MRALRWLTSEASVLPAIKDAGAINQLVPFLSREREGAVGPEAQLEALHALYNICKFNKRVHLEVRLRAVCGCSVCGWLRRERLEARRAPRTCPCVRVRGGWTGELCDPS